MPKRIFIGSLSLTTTETTLQRTFAPFGTIATVVVNLGRDGQSLGNANIEYTTEQAGSDAIAAKNRTELDNSIISVSAA